MTAMAADTALQTTDADTPGAVEDTSPDAERRPRDTLVITAAVAGCLALAAVVIVVLMWVYAFGAFGSQPGAGGAEGPGARPWHYWVSLFLASGVPFALGAIGFGYYWLTIRPRLQAG